MSFLRLLNPQGIAGIAASICWFAAYVPRVYDPGYDFDASWSDVKWVAFGCAYLLAAVAGADSIPQSVDRLMTHRGKVPNKSMGVYRLSGFRTLDSAVIAKRDRRESIDVERFIYQEVLPLMPLSRIECFGFF